MSHHIDITWTVGRQTPPGPHPGGVVTPRNPPNTKETAMTYTADSPATRRAVRTYWSTPGVQRDPAEALAAVLNEHKRGLRDRLAATQAVNEMNGKVIADLIAQRDDLAAKLNAAQAAPAAIVLPEITSEDVVSWRQVWVSAPTWREAVRAVATAYRTSLAASLPVWQPVEPGTWVGIGQRLRYESVDGTGATEHVTVKETVIAVRGWSILRTVPAEPKSVDPDAAAIAAMAAEAFAAIGEFPGLDITFDPGTDDDRDLCTQIARRTLAAYRAHVDKEA